MATLNDYLGEQLRQRIASLGVGSRFPTEAELCAEFSVSRMTVHKVVKRLAGEGLLVRNRRRGTFVQAPPVEPVQPAGGCAVGVKEMSSWLERGNPMRSVFALRTRNFVIHIEECVFSHRRRMWEEILAEVERLSPRVKMTISTRADEAEHADLVLFSLRSGPVQNIATDPVAVQAVRERCPRQDYFSAAWTGAENRHLAACPFAVSTDLYVWNLPLLQRHCPAFDGSCPSSMIDFVMRHGDWQADDFPPVASFMFYPPIQWLTEAVNDYGSDPRVFNLEHPQIRRYLQFNRHMAERIQAFCGAETLMNAGALWKLFNSGRLLAINTYSATLAVMPPQRQEQYMVHTPLAGKHAVIVPVYLGLGRAGRQPEEAADLIRLICGSTGQNILVSHYGNIPALRQAAYAPAFLDNSPMHMLQVLQNLDASESLMDRYPFLLVEQPHFDQFARYMLGDIDLAELCRLVRQSPPPPASPA